MSTGRVQLAAQGIVDEYLTGSPSFTYFLSVFKKHSRFALQAQEVNFDSANIDFGDEVIARITRFGDLVRTMYLKVTLPALPQDVPSSSIGYTDSIGHALIEHATLIIGGQTIERITGEYMELYDDLNVSDSQQPAIKKLIGTTGTRQGLGAATSSRTFIIPLPFYFYRNPDLAIPLVSLRYHEVEVHIKFRPLYELLVNSPGGDNVSVDPEYTEDGYEALKMTDANLIVDYIFLEEVERAYFQNTSLDYAITQLQRSETVIQTSSSENFERDFRLNFQNPVKELFFIIQDDSTVARISTSGNDWFNYTQSSTGNEQLDSLGLTFNGDDRIKQDVANALYLQRVQPLDYHIRTPSRSFYIYSFALRPGDGQPSGQANFSRIQDVLLRMKLDTDVATTKKVRVYALSYNIMRITSGMAGVLFNFNEY